MAISASTVTTTDTLETFRVEFNNLVADVTSIQQVGASNIVISDGGNIGSASDQDAISIAANGVVTFSQAPSFSTGLTVADVDIDGATDIGAAIVDSDLFIIDDGASGTNRKTAASRIKTYIADVTLTTAAQTNITSVGTLTALDVDNININGNTITASTGAVNITPASGSAIVLDGAVNIDAGVVTGITSLTSNAILIADAGTIGSASSTSAITIASTGIVTFVDDILIKDGGTIGAASATDAITIASTGIVTFVDDILIKDGGTIGVASAATAITIASTGIVTFVDDIIIKDGGTIGSVTDADSITIASDGKVTFGQQTTHSNGILVADGGTIGSASDTDAISISSGGVVAISATTANTDATDGALTVAGGASVAADFSVGDDLRLISDDAILSFGVNSDVTLTHVHNTGIRLSDSMALLLGTGDDISFSWDGTDGHLAVAGTLNVEGSGETLAKFIDDGAVELYHNNVKKFETTAAGVTLTGELQTTGFSSSDFAAAFIVIEDGGTDGSGTDAGDNIIIEDGGTDGAGANAGDDLLMENVTSWVTSGFTIRDSFGNHLQTVNGVS